MRAFIGLALPEAIRARLQRLQSELGASGVDVKWVEPANLHVTVKFLDEISEAQRQAIETMIGQVASREAPFELGLDGVGAFPSVNAPRVVWVGLAQGRESLVRIAQALEQEGQRIPLRREERAFAAHLTLGRVRSSKRLGSLAERLRSAAPPTPASWRVASLTLYQSVLGSGGPRYTVLADVPLGA
jgi:2'-5' RNA ligase